MSTHINANKGDISERVLLPGDPLRAKFIAETYLENVQCYNKVRGMYGFTGTYKGKKVSVQGTGMGAPSHGIYVNELIRFYGAKRLMRVGTCGSLNPEYGIGTVVLVQAAAADSSMNLARFGVKGLVYPPVPDFNLMCETEDIAARLGIKTVVGKVYSADQFYDDDGEEKMRHLMKYGINFVEMECAELFTLGAKTGVQTMAVLTVSDLIFEDKSAPAEVREKAFTQMMETALETI